MKLSPALICRDLSQVYRTSAGSSLSLKPTLKRPMLLGLDEKPGPGRCAFWRRMTVGQPQRTPARCWWRWGRGARAPVS